MNILYVENNLNFFNAVRREFLSEHNIVNFPTIKEALAELHEKKFDLILVDYDLDDGKGVELVREIRKTNSELPIIAVSSHEKGNNEMINSGADAYCAKLKFKHINAIIESVVL